MRMKVKVKVKDGASTAKCPRQERRVAGGGGRARVWVAVEVGGAEDLGEEGVGGALGEEVAVEPLCLDPGDVGELEGRHELHGEHARRGGRPEDLGHLLRVRVRGRARVRVEVGVGVGVGARWSMPTH